MHGGTVRSLPVSLSSVSLSLPLSVYMYIYIYVYTHTHTLYSDTAPGVTCGLGDS